ncbi:MAG: hypothetical protein BWZ10_03250 [candidate division BRC1 bacterium ADurb.BinA364]|nr:MAG: hypothetical protein BWZ10_03250 [candidate division BRC1 bacterium ADurb.BinA364]
MIMARDGLQIGADQQVRNQTPSAPMESSRGVRISVLPYSEYSLAEQSSAITTMKFGRLADSAAEAANAAASSASEARKTLMIHPSRRKWRKELYRR